jgi:hypothetical protein
MESLPSNFVTISSLPLHNSVKLQIILSNYKSSCSLGKDLIVATMLICHDLLAMTDNKLCVCLVCICLNRLSFLTSSFLTNELCFSLICFLFY